MAWEWERPQPPGSTQQRGLCRFATPQLSSLTWSRPLAPVSSQSRPAEDEGRSELHGVANPHGQASRSKSAEICEARRRRQQCWRISSHSSLKPPQLGFPSLCGTRSCPRWPGRPPQIRRRPLPRSGKHYSKDVVACPKGVRRDPNPGQKAPSLTSRRCRAKKSVGSFVGRQFLFAWSNRLLLSRVNVDQAFSRRRTNRTSRTLWLSRAFLSPKS